MLRAEEKKNKSSKYSPEEERGRREKWKNSRAVLALFPPFQWGGGGGRKK